MFAEEDAFHSIHLIKKPNGASRQKFSIEFHVLPESAQFGEPSNGGDFVHSPSEKVVHMQPSQDRVSIDFLYLMTHNPNTMNPFYSHLQ